jgi:phosphatidylglycerol lysyltransferase
MNKTKLHIPPLFHKQFFWQLILSLFMIGMAIFFVKNEHLELIDIKNKFSELNLFFVFLGALVTLLYIFLQGLMYVQSFKTLSLSLTIKKAITLFLKRNLISVFLPAGGFSSLVFFSKDIESKQISKSQIYLASTLFAILGILSVVFIAIPALYYALLKGMLHSAEIIGFAVITLLSVVLIIALYSLLRKGWLYYLVKEKRPDWLFFIDELSSNQFSKKHLINTLIISALIDVVGIIHLYIAMLALGFIPSLPAAIIGYIVMVILLIVSPLLRGLGAIEVSLTYILNQYGFSLTAAASITLLYRLFEFWTPLFISIASFFSKKDNVILRVLPALFIFAVGIVNIISVITPALPQRLHAIKNLLPADFILASNALVLISGLLLIIIAIFLMQGSKRAWYAAVILTSISIIGHITKGIDYEEAFFSSLALFSLYYTRSNYRLKSNPMYTKLSIQVIIYGFGAILLYGILGFYFMDKDHFGIDFHFFNSVKIVFKLFFLLNDSGLTPQTRFGEIFIETFYWASAAYLLFIAIGLLLPYFRKPYNTEEEIAQVKSLVARYGHSDLDYFKIYPDKLFFLTDDRQAFISFKTTRNIAVVLEDPVAESAKAMKDAVVAFDAYCKEIGLVSIYYRVPKESLSIYTSLNKKYFPIGEEAIVNLSTFNLEGNKMKSLRNSLNHLTNDGFLCKIHEAPIQEGLLQKLELVSNQWLAELGQKEITFTEGIFDASILKNQTIITIEDKEERVYAFLNLIPVYKPGMSSYDLIRKVADAPNGILDLLLIKTFFYLKEQGYQKVNMGLAQLSGIPGTNLTQKTVRFAYENLKAFGQFKGLRKYKEKFNPSWEKRYLVYDHDYYLLRVPRALRKVSES